LVVLDVGDIIQGGQVFDGNDSTFLYRKLDAQAGEVEFPFYRRVPIIGRDGA
jgi:hypothetical protein